MFLLILYIHIDIRIKTEILRNVMLVKNENI